MKTIKTDNLSNLRLFAKATGITILLCLVVLPHISFGQNIPITNTSSSKTNDQEVRSENYSFSMTNWMLSITNLDRGTKETYGPLRYESDGNEGGYYYQGYLSDIYKDPLRYRREKPRAYKFYYDKNGFIIAILEGKIRQDNVEIIKIYYTE